jgi:hypothetical protein
MEKQTITSILDELSSILSNLESKGVNLNREDHAQTAELLKQDLRENKIAPTKTFLQKMLKTAKDLFPIVVPIIKALLI